MNHSTAIFLINNHARAVLATYEPEAPGNGKPVDRTMFKTLDPDIRAGDFVVVPTESRHKMTVVKVVEVDVDVDFDSETQVNWVIGKVDREAYERILAQEGAAISTIKKADRLKKRNDLRDSLLANSKDDLKLLPIAEINGEGAPKAE